MDAKENKFEAYYFSGEIINNLTTLTALLILFERIHIDVLGYETLCSKGKGALSYLFPKLETPIDQIISEKERNIKRLLPLFEEGIIIPHRNGFTIDDNLPQGALNQIWFFRTSRISSVIGQGVEAYNDLIFRDIIATTSMMKLSPSSVVVGDRFIPAITNQFGDEVRLFENQHISSLAGFLAFHSVQMSIPPFVPESIDDILEIREKLKGYISPFWNEMKKLSWELYKLQKTYKGLEIENDIQALFDSSIIPLLFDLKKKIYSEKMGIWSKFLHGTTNLVKIVSKSFNPADILADFLKSLLDVDSAMQKYIDTRYGNYALLLELPKIITKYSD